MLKTATVIQAEGGYIIRTLNDREIRETIVRTKLEEAFQELLEYFEGRTAEEGVKRYGKAKIERKDNL